MQYNKEGNLLHRMSSNRVLSQNRFVHQSHMKDRHKALGHGLYFPVANLQLNSEDQMWNSYILEVVVHQLLKQNGQETLL